MYTYELGQLEPRHEERLDGTAFGTTISLVSKREKLLEAVRNNPRDVHFEDLLRLIEALGFMFDRQNGSHRIYQHKNPAVPMINVQDTKTGKAKPYQVEQVLSMMDKYRLEV